MEDGAGKRATQVALVRTAPPPGRPALTFESVLAAPNARGTVAVTTLP